MEENKIEPNRKLPIYALIIDEADESGVDFVALVDKPAIAKNWMAFDDLKSKYEFKITNQDKRIITGALMIPDLPIYRRDEMGEYYVFFSAETIMQIVEKYFRKGNTNNVNMMHNDNMVANGVYMFESFVADKSRGIQCPVAFEGMPDGTWFGSFKVDNNEIWNDYIKNGIFKGFSVEGIFQHKYVVDKQEDQIKSLSQKILSLREKLNAMK